MAAQTFQAGPSLVVWPRASYSHPLGFSLFLSKMGTLATFGKEKDDTRKASITPPGTQQATRWYRLDKG